MESVRDLEDEIERLMAEIEEDRKKLREEKNREEKSEIEKTETKRVTKSIPVKISYGGYDFEFNIKPQMGPTIPTIKGIPEKSNPTVDSELWYLRTQAMMGSDYHHRIEESLQKLKELGVSESVINEIRKQFEKPVEQRDTIPLTGESERFLWELHDRLKNIVLSKFPEAPEVERYVWNAIFNAISANGWSNKEKIRRSAEGYIRNLLRGGF